MNVDSWGRILREVRADNAEMASDLNDIESLAAKVERAGVKAYEAIGRADSSDAGPWLNSPPSTPVREELHLREMAALKAKHAAEDKALILGGELKEARVLLDRDRESLKHMEAMVRYLLDQVGGTLVLTPHDVIELNEDRRRVMIYSDPDTLNVTVRMED